VKALGLILVLLTSGCATGPQPIRGIFFTDVTGPNQAIASAVPLAKRGTACARTILALWTWGDASISAAKAAGKITEIAAIDYEVLAVLSFVYAQTCTVVSGA
jgi:hypothetical protein